MRKLRIDFARNAARSPWAGRVVFGVALALSVHAAHSYRSLQASLERHETSLARGEPRSAAARKLAPSELAVVRDTLERLALPWQELFGALESAANPDVALLAIEPDSRTGNVVISAEGRNYLAALSYVLELARSDALTGVQLVRHEAKANDPPGAVGFAVSAGWTAVRR